MELTSKGQGRVLLGRVTIADASHAVADSKLKRGARPRRHTMPVSSDGYFHARWSKEHAIGTMSPAAFIVNMFADLCPPGFLPLASGMASTGVAPGVLLVVLFYGLCTHTMFTVGKSTDITGATTFAEQWAIAVSEKTSWLPTVVVACVCFGCTISYACFYADIFSSALPLTRSQCLVGFALLPMLPLCMLKDLSALAPSSFVAFLSVIYTAIVMVIRCCDGSYAHGGRYYSNLAVKPDVPDSHAYDFGPTSLVLVNMLAMGYLAHYNGCKYYRELVRHSPKKFVRVTATAMGISAVLFTVTMIAGFKTFGMVSNGVILKNYAGDDLLVKAARLGMGTSIIAPIRSCSAV